MTRLRLLAAASRRDDRALEFDRRRSRQGHLPRHLLYRMIAYCLQAERLGDLDRDTQQERFRSLRELALATSSWQRVTIPAVRPPARNHPGAGVG